MAKPGKKKKRKAKAKKTLAQRADRHALYQGSVQVPEADVEFFTDVFKKIRGRKPLSLREDFCGTAYLSSTWVASSKKRTAHGVDLEPEVLAWGKKHNLSKLNAEQRSRVTLTEGNVLHGAGGESDIVCAMNFSYCVFKQRSVLRDYFKVVYDKTKEGGLFFTELYGGFEGICEVQESRDCEGFEYVWEQANYNPITHETLCHIHFKFSDGSKIRKAFTYDWRLWSIPELRELMTEVGFSDTKVFWEIVDGDGEGTGDFKTTEEEENQDSWLCYIVGIK